MSRNLSGKLVLLAVALPMILLAACAAPTVAPAPSRVVQQTVVVQPTAAPAAPPVIFKREETLYTGGKQWGPVSTWNPFNNLSYAMGTIGLVYETLFRYDPLTDKFIPWLTESGQWVDAKTYELKLRQGLTWSNGSPLTVDDVKFTFELGKVAALNFSTTWDWLTSIDQVDANTLKFNFKDPLYQEWANNLYNVPIVPQSIWSKLDAKTVATGANDKPVGSGPYLYESVDQTKMVWVRNENWWAIEALNLKVAPKRIVDIINTSNENALGLVLQGQEDLNNNYLPGISTLVQGGYAIHTYYAKPPYHLAGNTVWLEINLQKKPMNDVKFRQALAYAINVNDIVSRDYGNMVQAANPTGLPPVWDKYVDQDVVNQLGFTYDPAKARQILTAAGYQLGANGFFSTPDGSPIALRIIAPNGWSDWMTAIQMISANAKAVGINIIPDYPNYNDFLDARLKGTFDLAIDNQAQISSTPWSYYSFIFYSKLADIPSTQGGNYGRYNNQKAFDLVTQLDKTPVDDLEAIQSICSQLQTIQLTDLPIIPLWYNGAWAQFNNTYWTNWPGAGDKQGHYFPITWNGYWNMTSIDMLTQLQPTPKK